MLMMAGHPGPQNFPLMILAIAALVLLGLVETRVLDTILLNTQDRGGLGLRILFAYFT